MCLLGNTQFIPPQLSVLVVGDSVVPATVRSKLQTKNITFNIHQ